MRFVVESLYSALQTYSIFPFKSCTNRADNRYKSINARFVYIT